jgi:ABC-type transport system involved in multi-copper enzyme maturation permease subunit
MFWEFLRFEWKYWLRGWMIYIFLAIVALLFFGAATSDQIQIGGAFGPVHRNAPYAIQRSYAIASILCALMVAAFIDGAATRDFTTGSRELVFSKPIRRWGYLLGRFFGGMTASLIPMLGVSLGIVVAGLMPWIDVEDWGKESWLAHVRGFLMFALPNTLFFAAVVFAIATTTRSTLLSYLGLLAVLVLYAIAQSYLGDLRNQKLATLLDPLGIAAFGVETRYWTVDEKNTQSLGWTESLVLNRALWGTVSLAIMAIGGSLFSFADRSKSKRRQQLDGEATAASATFGHAAAISIPKVAAESHGLAWWLQCFGNQFLVDSKAIFRSTTFLVLAAISLLNTLPALWLDLGGRYGVSSFPVTYMQVEKIEGSLNFFLLAMLTVFAGWLIWRDRDAKMHEMIGSTAAPQTARLLAHLASLLALVAAIYLLAIFSSVLSQASRGYHRYQWGVYFQLLFGNTFWSISFLAVLAIACHALAPNKYLGYAIFIAAAIVLSVGWSALGIDSLLFRFGETPRVVYSEFYGVQPFVSGWLGFSLYWTLFCSLLLWFAAMIVHRGVPASLKERLRRGWRSMPASMMVWGLVSLAGWLGLGGYLGYQTMVLNKIIPADAFEKSQAEYEKSYKKNEKHPAPRIESVKYQIDLDPPTRNMVMKADRILHNRTGGSIDTIFVTFDPRLKHEVKIERGAMVMEDKKLGFSQWKIEPPMEAGERLKMDSTTATAHRGIENQVSDLQFQPNGTFFNNELVPSIGYQVDREISDPKARKKQKLEGMLEWPELSRENREACFHHYLGEPADWVDVETVISTTKDQIAVAPGSLIEQWTEGDRAFFRYKLDHPSMNFYSFISAKYDVLREKQGEVDVEVYYHPEHAWNIERMAQAVKDSIAYCGQQFGPFRHKQARIVEFPRVASFAQAFPGTMPYSESIGFIDDLRDPEKIDVVYYVVAHEMAHQWWAHQVVGARMQGATLLSETLAQYTALMLMERRYGKGMMRVFLKYELDAYLEARGSSRREEKPLLRVEPSQGYIHYNKGSVVLYALKELMGENRINTALKELVDAFAYKDPPYPTSLELVDRLKKHAPQELHGWIDDQFGKIVLYENRLIDAKVVKLPDGKYEVTGKATFRKVEADGKGAETQVKLADWIEIGVIDKPKGDAEEGEVSKFERIFVDGSEATFRLVVDEEPYQVAVDPRCLLIDRVPGDNVKKPDPATSKANTVAGI